MTYVNESMLTQGAGMYAEQFAHGFVSDDEIPRLIMLRFDHYHNTRTMVLVVDLKLIEYICQRTRENYLWDITRGASQTASARQMI